MNSSYEIGKNKSAVSFNHYLSHNIKDNNHNPDGYDGPHSAALPPENIS